MNTKMEMSQLKKDLEAWKKTASAIETIQDKVSIADKPKDLILELLNTKLPLDNISELSILYLSFGESTPSFLVCSGESYSKDKHFPIFKKDNKYILDSIRENTKDKTSYFSTKEQCKEAGFSSYQSILIVPMRLSLERSIGVFVFHNKEKENAYSGEIQYTLDMLSDRVAYFIRSLIRSRLHNTFDHTRNALLGTPFEKECEIAGKLVDLMKEWYGKTDSIYILIKNPINTDTFYLVYGDNGINTGFRLKNTISTKEMHSIVGKKDVIEKLEEGKGLVIDSLEVQTSINSKCKSWLGAAMHHPSAGYCFGYIILQNQSVINAYEHGDEKFLDGLADFTAVLLADFRKKERQTFIRKIANFKFDDKHTENFLYDEVYNFLHRMYGVKSLQVTKINNDNQELRIVYENKNSTLSLEKNHYDKINKHIQSLRTDWDTNSKKLTLKIKKKSYLITPMRTGSTITDWKVIGCFIIPVVKTGDVSAKSIDEISDALAVKANKWGRLKRNKTLNNYGKRVNTLKTEKVSIAIILEKARRVISKVMYTENLYIALYDKKVNIISFPLIFINGNSWPTDSRSLNPKEQGKTEAIILDKKPILHLTHEESKAWYTDLKHPERKEFKGDYLASWVGVPIFSPDGIIGVIASYHSTADHIYSQGDVFFLENVASQVSALFSRLSEAQAKEEALKAKEEALKAQNEIAETQDILSTSLLAQDLVHRLNNSVGAALINVRQTHGDIDESINTKEVSPLINSLDSLDDAEMILESLIEEVSQLSDSSKQEIAIKPLLEKIIAQVFIAKRLDSINVITITDIPENLPNIIAHRRILFNSLYALVDNSADALIAQQKIENRDLILAIDVDYDYDQSNLIIQVEDNGVPIPQGIFANIFKYGVTGKANSSGFGLWRANAVIQNLGGSISPPTLSGKKIFTITLPIDKSSLSSEKLVYVLDDERSWRNILKKWLELAGYTVELTKNKSEMLDLLENQSTFPSYVFLDISLENLDGANLDGLSLIKRVREKSPDTKIVIVTGFSHSASFYDKEYDLLLEKVNGKGVLLDKKHFINEIEKI